MKRAIVVSAALSALAGCTTAGKSSGGGLFGGSANKDSAVYITALQGGIVQRSGVQLSNSDRQRALEAEYRALEAAPGGQPVAWSGGNVRGEVVAAAPYQVGAQNCRQYTHKLTAGGRQAEARGAACRNNDGTWSPLT
jgi:Surface antigen